VFRREWSGPCASALSQVFARDEPDLAKAALETRGPIVRGELIHHEREGQPGVFTPLRRVRARFLEHPQAERLDVDV
jgi:hypothetical protein